MNLFLFKSFKTQLTLILILIITLFFIILNAIYIPNIHASLWTEKKAKVKTLVQSQMAVIEHYWQQAEKGELTVEQAKARASLIVSNARYGETGRDYFWINDMKPAMVMHPYKPQLNGKDVSNVKDPGGVYLFRRFVETVQDGGSGYVPYQWQYYDQEKRVEPKISYVQEFAPWNWIVGTGVYVNDVRSTVISVFLKSVAIGLAGIVVFGAMVFFIARKTAIPIIRASGFADDLAGGKLDIEPLEVNRRDEIGTLVTALNNMMKNLAGIIEEIKAVVNTITSSTELNDISVRLTETSEDTVSKANSVASAAEEMSSNMTSVASAMEQAAVNVGTVASGIEEMSDTISENSRNAGKAKEVTARAVQQAHNTTVRINELGKAAEEIGEVTETITQISSQTDLLALNATIESARAGEAGKGFAVVANEIKALARQTAEATFEISQKIKDIQESSRGSVSEIEEISGIINKVDEFVGSIAIAAEQQDSTTKEIAENISQISQGINEVNENVAMSADAAGEVARDIAGINQSASELSGFSAKVYASANQLNALAEQLNTLMNRFSVK